MEVELTGRVTGPYGEFSRRTRLFSPQIPVPYLQHLVAIGVATVIAEHSVEQPLEVKRDAPKKTSSASQAAPASRKKTATKRKPKPKS